MRLRQRGYLTESSSRELWNQFCNDPNLVKLMRSLGFDPNDKSKEWKGVCPECGKKAVVKRERHADTSMNYIEHRCTACNYRREV